jgi:non-ribosomal peptide synthase protein (TIGR01720 family)
VGELRGHLKTKLPEYMVPTAFVVLERLPLTANGKLDRRALPAPERDRQAAGAGYAAPRTREEQELARIWAQVLGVKEVGIHDNFFALGGDSILSIQVIARAGQAGLHLTLRHFFQHPTVAELAEVAGTVQAMEAEQGLVTGPAPLTPIQRWFFEQNLAEPQHWNTSILLEVAPSLDPGALEQALQHVLAHHDALRLRFTRAETGWRQHNAPLDERAPFQAIDLSAMPARKHRQAVEAHAAALQRSLNLAEGPLVRVAYFDLGARRPGRLLIIFHHLVIDGVSLRIVLADLLTVYQQLARGAAAELPPKTSAFQTWARRLAAYAQEPALRGEFDYWTQIARRPLAALPVDYPGGANTYGSAQRVFASLKAGETRALLQEVPSAYGVQISDILLCALALTFARWTGSHRLLVEQDLHGRQDVLAGVDVSRTAGWFTSIFPLLLEVDRPDDLSAALGAVRDQLERLPWHGVGYGLLRYLCDDQEVRARMRAVPQPQVNFNYLGQFEQGAFEVTPEVPLRIAPESPGAEQDPQGVRPALIYIVGTVADGTLDIMWSYSANVHKRSTIERLAKQYIVELRRLIAHCLAAEQAIGR